MVGSIIRLRPLTFLGKSTRPWDDHRLQLYRAGREALLSEGYTQVSMRMFQLARAHDEGPAYCCQADGMVGLGAGARSYTRDVHYCTEYAVGRRGVKAILDDFVTRDDGADAYADYGYGLDDEERRRRHVLLSLLTADGLVRSVYRERFGTDALHDFPQLQLLAGMELMQGTEVLRLTPRGFELTDAIGPWLYSDAVRGRMQEFELR